MKKKLFIVLPIILVAIGAYIVNSKYSEPVNNSPVANIVEAVEEENTPQTAPEAPESTIEPNTEKGMSSTKDAPNIHEDEIFNSDTYINDYNFSNESMRELSLTLKDKYPNRFTEKTIDKTLSRIESVYSSIPLSDYAYFMSMMMQRESTLTSGADEAFEHWLKEMSF